MEILEVLKKFKHIKPGEDYTLHSREIIVASPFVPAPERIGPWRAFVQSIQFGSAIALVGAGVLLIMGAFSSWKFLSPFRTASLDITALRAEAEAINMQVQLTDINYTENSKAGASAKKVLPPEINDAAEKIGLTPATSSEAMTIEDSLNKLAE